MEKVLSNLIFLILKKKKNKINKIRKLINFNKSINIYLQQTN